MDHDNKVLSSCWVLGIRKWFGRWGVKELLELFSDAMQYAIS
jgi:hypothetical protein